MAGSNRGLINTDDICDASISIERTYVRGRGMRAKAAGRDLPGVYLKRTLVPSTDT